MRILTIVHSLNKGGTERAAVNFAIAYRDIGHDSRILYTTMAGCREQECQRNGIIVYSFQCIEHVSMINHWNPEICHLHSHGLDETSVFRIRASNPRALFVETNVFSIPSPWECILTKSFQLSNWCLWLYVRRGGDSEKAQVVPNPVNCSGFYNEAPSIRQQFREKYGISADTLLLGRIGQAFDGKWAPLTIKAFEAVKSYHSDTRLLIVNPPSSIQKLANQSIFHQSITIIDQIEDDDELRSAYSSMDIFLHTADQGESFGMAIAEALLCETPVVTLATPWGDNTQIEVCSNKNCGFAVDSSVNFIKAVIRLAKDLPARVRMGQCGRSYIIKNYESRAVAMNLIQATYELNLQKVITPRDLYNIQGHPNIFTKFLLNSYLDRDLLRYTCDPTFKGIYIFVKIYLKRYLRRLFNQCLRSIGFCRVKET